MVTGAGSPSANGFYRLAEQQVTYELGGKARQGPQWQQVDSPAWRIIVTDVPAEEAHAARAGSVVGGGGGEKRPSSMGTIVVWQICKVGTGVVGGDSARWQLCVCGARARGRQLCSRPLLPPRSRLIFPPTPTRMLPCPR